MHTPIIACINFPDNHVCTATRTAVIYNADKRIVFILKQGNMNTGIQSSFDLSNITPPKFSCAFEANYLSNLNVISSNNAMAASNRGNSNVVQIGF
ncbi:hypothetical protein QFZ97_004037 [Paraburkholderia youngii]